MPLPVIYDNVSLDIGYRIDLLVENEIIVEIKSIEKVAPVHKAQLLSYLRLSKKRVGLLLNFNVTHLREGIHRVVNGPNLKLAVQDGKAVEHGGHGGHGGYDGHEGSLE